MQSEMSQGLWEVGFLTVASVQSEPEYWRWLPSNKAFYCNRIVFQVYNDRKIPLMLNMVESGRKKNLESKDACLLSAEFRKI